MKNFKSLILTLVLCLTIGSGAAFAGWGIPIGNIDTDVAASNSDHSSKMDIHIFSGPAGIAVGGGSINGGAGASAEGAIVNGTINADLGVNAGGNSQSGKTAGLGTYTNNLAYTGASVDLDANARFGIGGVAGSASGSAEQCSLNTGLGLANGGVTSGLATQQSAGGFSGDALVGVVLRGSPEAGFNASIQMNGSSATNSFKTADGLGTAVRADTLVQSLGGSYTNGFIACADVDGGFSASGSVSTSTLQGGASASANGSYSGAASLGKTYTGSAVGYSETANGANGVNSAWARMKVTSTITKTVTP